MLLTRKAFFLLLLTAVLLALGALVPLATALAAGYLGVVFTLLLVDWFASPKPRDFTVTRTHDERLSLGADNDIDITVHSRNRRRIGPGQLIVRDEYPIEFQASTDILTQPITLATSATTNPNEQTFRYTVRPPRRGDYRFGNVNLRWQGVLGLMVRQATFPKSGPVKVYPNLLNIRQYELLARKGQLAELGLRRMRQLGNGTEFERLRDYQSDDEFRRVDWNATARRGRPVTREFETERSQNIMIMLDVGRLMRSPVQDLAKVDYAINAALLLTYVAGMRGDKVGLIAFADDVTTYLAPKQGKGQFYRMLATLYGLQSQPVESSYTRAFTYLNNKQKKRSLVVIFSDLASGLAEKAIISQVTPLVPRHVPLLVAINDPTMIALTKQAPDSSQPLYQRGVAEQMLSQRAIIMQSLRLRGVNTIDVPANQLTVSVIDRYLELKSRGRI